MAPVKLAERRRQDADTQHFLLYGVDWRTYLRVLKTFDDRHLRITYDRGALELMTLSFGHENNKCWIGRFIDIIAEELHISICPAGSTTLKRRKKQRGLEPDNSYYIQNAPLVLHKDKIDLRVDPPPDLGVEVDVTHSSLDRMGIYAAIKVPEIWRYDGLCIRVYQLGPDGKYVECERSPTFPMIPIAELTKFLQRKHTIDATALLREFRAWVRGLLQSPPPASGPADPSA